MKKYNVRRYVYFLNRLINNKMTIEEIIKEAFSQGWNASHECATDFDYECALRNCLSDLDSEVKKLNIPVVIKSVCDHEPLISIGDEHGTTYCPVCKEYNPEQTVL